MALKKELVQFSIVNDTNCDFNLPLLQRNVFSINAKTKYSWDITGQSLACGVGTIVINGQTLTFTFANNLISLIQSLTALGYGFFCSEIVAGRLYVYTQDDTNTYGNLVLCPVVTTTTTTTTTTATPTTTTTTSTTTSTTTVPPNCLLAGTAVVN